MDSLLEPVVHNDMQQLVENGDPTSAKCYELCLMFIPYEFRMGPNVCKTFKNNEFWLDDVTHYMQTILVQS